MIRDEDFRPAFICDGNDTNGNPCPLRQLPVGVFERFIRPVTVPIFAANGQQLFLQQLPVRTNDMQPDRVRIWKLMQGTPPGFERTVSSEPPDSVPQEAASEHAKTSEPEDEANNPVNFASCNERFNGFTDVRPFIDNVLEFKKSSAMNDESALQSFPSLLSGMANRWWQANNASITDWDSVIKLLRNSYRVFPLPSKRNFHPVFCVPQLNDCADDYLDKVEELFKTIIKEDSTDEAQLDKIYSALHDSIKHKLSRADCNSFTELYKRAHQVADEITDPSATPPSSTPELPNALADSGEPEVPVNSPPADHSGETKTTCNHCISYGDLLIRMCRKSNRGQRTKEELKLLENINQMDKEEFSKMICSHCHSPNMVSKDKIKSTPESPSICPQVTVRIFEQDFNFIVDTGSSFSIASEDLLAHLLTNGQELKDLKAWIGQSSGSRKTKLTLQLVRVATVDVSVGDVKISTKLVEFENIDRNVFGIDFIKKAGLVMDFSGAGTWTVQGATEKYPLLYDQFPEPPKEQPQKSSV